ncbi:MAG: DUF4388 domain-containing protein [Planctomycetota bacterium]
MGVRGSLGTVKLSDIFQMLALNPEPQTLRVRPEGSIEGWGRPAKGEQKTFVFTPDRVTVYFEGGLAAVALGDILVNLGKLAEEDLARALKAQRASGKPTGEVLVEMGLVQQEDVGLALRKQIEEEIYEVLSWSRGEFSVSEGVPAAEEVASAQRVIRLSFNVTGLLMEAVRRIDELERAKATVPSLDDVYLWKEGRSAEGVTAEAAWQKRMLARIGKKETLRRTMETLRVGRFETLTFVATLVQQGEIESLAAGDLRKLVVPALTQDNIEEGLAMGERVVELLADDPSSRQQLGGIYEQLKLPRQAAGHLVEAARLYSGKGEFARAKELLEQALALQRDSAVIRGELLEAAIRSEDLSRAKKVGMELLVSELAGRSGDAAETVKRLAEIAPDDIALRLRVAGVLVSYRRAELATQEAVAVAARDPGRLKAKLISVCQQILEVDPSRQQVAGILRSASERSVAGMRRRAVVVRWVMVIAVAACVSAAAYQLWIVLGRPFVR